MVRFSRFLYIMRRTKQCRDNSNLQSALLNGSLVVILSVSFVQPI